VTSGLDSGLVADGNQTGLVAWNQSWVAGGKCETFGDDQRLELSLGLLVEVNWKCSGDDQ